MRRYLTWSEPAAKRKRLAKKYFCLWDRLTRSYVKSQNFLAREEAVAMRTTLNAMSGQLPDAWFNAQSRGGNSLRRYVIKKKVRRV